MKVVSVGIRKKLQHTKPCICNEMERMGKMGLILSINAVSSLILLEAM